MEIRGLAWRRAAMPIAGYLLDPTRTHLAHTRQRKKRACALALARPWAAALSHGGELNEGGWICIGQIGVEHHYVVCAAGP